MSARGFRWWVPVSVVLVTLGADQASKAWARDTLSLGHPVSVIDGLWDWELGFNRGMAFSLFGDGGARAVLTIIGIIAVVAIGVMIARSRPEQRLLRVGLALAAGGALGNLLDRLSTGAVTDFVRWRYESHRWPIFNIADVALAFAVGILLLTTLRPSRPASGAAARA